MAACALQASMSTSLRRNLSTKKKVQRRLSPCPASGLIVHGTRDNVVPEPDVQKLVDSLTAQKGIKITYNKIDGANHFFDKHEADVVETVKEYVSNMMSKPREGR